MTIAQTAFTVVSEFRFDVAKAVIGAEQLQGAVDELSKSAEAAVANIASVGMSFVSSFSGAKGGIMGLLYNAISASDKFKSSQIEIANTMLANKMKLGDEFMDFNTSLRESERIMGNVVKLAQELRINPNELAAQFKMYNNFLAPKGLAGKDLSTSVDLARVAMKAAPALGVSNDQVQGGIMSGISGQLSANTQFGSRLFMEAGDAIIKSTGIKTLKDFNAASPEKRVKALIAGLDKLAGSADTVKARADLLTVRIDTIKNLFTGVGSILKPLGDAVLPLVKNALDLLIDFLGGKAKKTIEIFSFHLKHLLGDDPKALINNLMDLSNASSSLGRAIKTTGLVMSMALMAEHFHHLAAVKFLGIGKIFEFIQGIGAVIRSLPVGKQLMSVLDSLIGIFKIGSVQGGWFVKILKVFMITAARAAGLIGVLLVPFQGFVQALNRAKVEWMEWIMNNLPRLTTVGANFVHAMKQLFIPFTDLVKGFEELFFLLVGGTQTMDFAMDFIEAMTALLDFLKWFVGGIWSVIRALIAGVTAFITSVLQNFIPKLIKGLLDFSFAKKNNFEGMENPFKEALEFFMDEGNRTFERFTTPTMKDGVENQGKEVHNHHYDVKMTNHFKEVLQPDRIAFTISEQLKKASTYSTGGGSSIATKQLQGGN
jgi:hypothetical protein